MLNRVSGLMSAVIASLALILAGCGGGSLSGTSDTGGGGGGTTTACASIILLASSSQLQSAPTASVSFTAICKDSNNAGVVGAVVTFKTSAGVIAVTQGTTDTAGNAIAVLTSAGSTANQTISVSALSGSVSSNTVVINEVGTSLTLTGPNVVGSGAQSTFTSILVDSAGNPIAGQSVKLSSSLGNPVSAPVTTNSSGSATFTYTGNIGGVDSLTATSTTESVSSAPYSLTVSSTALTFTAPTSANLSIPFNQPTTVTVQYIKNGVATSGEPIAFSSTRGSLSPGNVTTGAGGAASSTLSATEADGAGSALITVIAADGTTASLPLIFIATTPASITVQATPSTLALKGSSTILATVRDAYLNPVANKTVQFHDSDTVSGALSASTAVTNSDGQATVIYTASSVSSSQNGVVISANVANTSISSSGSQDAYITVGGKAVNIVLGTGNTVAVLNATQYQLPYVVEVSDSAGNPANGAVVNLQLQATAFQIGQQKFGTVWAPVPGATPADPYYNGKSSFNYSNGTLWFDASTYPRVTAVPFGCVTEDPADTTILTAPTVYDYNKSGSLEPGGPADLPIGTDNQTVTLDSTGSYLFYVTYPKNFAQWVQVLITASTTVGGTAGTAYATFTLPVLAADVSTSTVAPPGQFSPFGNVGSCVDSIQG